jgi:hypothetical protein
VAFCPRAWVQNAIQLKEKEFTLHNSNFATVGTQVCLETLATAVALTFGSRTHHVIPLVLYHVYRGVFFRLNAVRLLPLEEKKRQTPATSEFAEQSTPRPCCVSVLWLHNATYNLLSF